MERCPPIWNNSLPIRDIPKKNVVKIFPPRSANKNLLSMVEIQNEGLRFPKWKILGNQEEGKSQLMTIGFDKKSGDIVADSGHAIDLRFG